MQKNGIKLTKNALKLVKIMYILVTYVFGKFYFF